MDAPPHDHEHDDDRHHHDDAGATSGIRRALGLGAPHRHDAADRVDQAMETSAEGIRALKVSLVGLGLTAVLQGTVVAVSGSVALLGDTLHNVADALTAVPLWIAFRLGRRRPTRAYPYGFGRAEDLAGLCIVFAIAASALVAGYESLLRLVEPGDVSHLWVVAAASVVGCAGNELVARYRIRVGRRIGSAALVADGMHARSDSLTSLAVLLGAAGVAAGVPAADAIVGLAITAAILVILRGVARDVYRRLMDAVDPALLDEIERVARSVEGVATVGPARARWIGHRIRAEVEIGVDASASVVDGHDAAGRVLHELLHEVPRLATAVVHVNPDDRAGVDHHRSLAHHLEAGEGGAVDRDARA